MSTELAVQKIGQIAIAVSDLDAAMEFYQDLLGLPLLFKVPPGLAFFDCGGTRLMLTTQQGLQKDHRTSVIYYSVADILAATEAIKQRGGVFEQEPQLVAKMDDHDLWIGFLRDPDENLVGLMAEVPFATS